MPRSEALGGVQGGAQPAELRAEVRALAARLLTHADAGA
jgi:hypothetical protein